MITIPETEEDRQRKEYLQSTYGWTIQNPEYDTLPSVAEKYRFGNENIVPDFEQDAGFQLLRTYTLIDRFWEDHTTRRAFYIALEKESPDLERWIAGHNKLGINRINFLNTAAYLIRERFPNITFDPAPSATDFQKYRTFSLPQKIELVQRFEKGLYGLFQKLSE